MARLIDADKFKQQIAAVTIMNNFDAEFANKLCELVENQPTAYDVDNVVEQFEKKRDEVAKSIELNSQSYDIKEEIESVRKHYEWIIQVIKSGWKE